MGRHLEAVEFDQPLAAGGAVGRVELVDAELGAVGVAGVLAAAKNRVKMADSQVLGSVDRGAR